MLDPFIMFAPIYGPGFLGLLFWIEVTRAETTSMLPRPGSILAAIPAIYGLGLCYLMLMSAPTGSMRNEALVPLMIASLIAGAATVVGFYVTAVRLRSKRQR